MPSPENEDEEFDFYVKFAKPLVLNLPNTNDRIKAATWIRFLKNDTTDPVQRGEYLKLLLFVLQRRKLFGPFATVPDESKPLEKFPEEINIQDVAKNFVEIDKQILKATLQRGGYGEWPPYNVACSSDLTEYASSQEIPNFGVQSYFAVSQDPLKYWNKSEKAMFPIGERIETLQPECPLMDTMSPDISCFVSGDQADSAPPGSPGSPRPTPRISPSKGTKDAQPKGLEDVAPKYPKQPSPLKQMDEFNMEARVPPSWGSNLVNVKDSPPPTTLADLSPLKDLDIEVSDQDMLDFFNDDIDLFEADVDEAASYLQGEGLLSPERPQPTGPLSPARVVTPQRPQSPVVTSPPRVVTPQRPQSPAVVTSPARVVTPQKPQSPASSSSPDGFGSPPSPMTPCAPYSPAGLVSPARVRATAPMTPQRTPQRVKTPPMPCRVQTPSTGATSPGSPMSPPDWTPSPCSKPSSFKPDSPPYPRKFPQTPPSPKPILSPDKLFNALEYIAADRDMLDFYNESLTLPDDDPAFFLQGDALGSPERPARFAEQSPDDQLRQIEEELSRMSGVVDDEELKKLEAEVFGDSRSPVYPQVASLNEEDLRKREDEVYGEFADKERPPKKAPPPIPKPVKRPAKGMNYFQKRMAELEKKQLGSPAQEVATTVQQVLEEINQPSTSALQTAGEIIEIVQEEDIQEEEEDMDRSGVGLGGDSFIAPKKRDYGWFRDLPPGVGIPQDEQQDPALWESFGWWTDDPDEIFMYMTPSPRGKRAEPDDPYEVARARWAENAPHTPPLFSRDPKIRAGPGAQRQYNIDEFGMLSFEEPVWTSAEQYFKYKQGFSPYTDPRDIDRKTLDPSQFPKYESPTLKRRFSDIQGSQDEEQIFGATPPDFADISLTDLDKIPMTKVEAKREAMRHGPQYIGLPPTPKQKTPEADEGEWADTEFLKKTPPPFVLEPPFLATPPEYEPNQEIDVDNLDDSIGKYIEEDLKIINAKIPVTTPQRSSSPKRSHKFLQESPPFVPEIDVEPDPYIPSPDKIPERHVVPPQKLVSWDANIGTPVKFKQLDAIIIESEDEIRDKNIKRKNELRLMYEKMYESPEKIPTPPPFPHLMDSHVPRRLPPAMPATKLPPPGWDYKTPPNLKHTLPPLRQYQIPTGISPPKPSPPRPQDISMYNESPPEGFMSPGMAIGDLMFSPSESFGAASSPRWSPGKVRPDGVGMESRDFVVHPKPGQSFRVRGSPKTPPRDVFDMAQDFEGLDDNIELYQTPPDQKTPVRRPQAPATPDITKAELDAEISALEAELQLLKTPEQRPRPRGPDDMTPELERQLWLQSVKHHEPVRYQRNKKSYVVPAPAKGLIEVKSYNPPQLQTIMSPRHPKDPQEECLQRIEDYSYQANRDVISDMRDLHRKKKEVPRHYNFIYYHNRAITDSHYSLLRHIRLRNHKPKMTWPESPPYSPEPVPHLMDEPVPEDLPRGMIVPGGWNYKTPPHLKYTIPPEREYKTPTGISPPREHKLPPKGTLFYESPPDLVESPEMNLDFSSFSLPSSHEGAQVPPRIHPPDRVPTARDFRAPDILDLAQMYPQDFEGLDEEMEFYLTPPRPGSPTGQSRPPRQPSPEMTQAELEAEIAALESEVFVTPKERRPLPVDDLTPEIDRRIWQESIKLHDPVEYDRKRIWVVPGPAKLRDTMREVTGLQAPPFDPIYSPREMERREWMDSIKQHKPVEYERKRIWVAPAPAKVRDTMREVTGLQAPPFDPIMSPRRPVDPEKQRQAVIQQMKFQAGYEVMRDMTELHKPWKARPQYDPDHFQRIQDDLRSRREQYARSQPVIQSPASPPLSPIPPPHLLDEELPEGLPPGLLPPSGWNWQTPPKLKFKMPYQRRYETPTGISPPRPKGVDMFSESPPPGFDSSILEDDSLQLVYDSSAPSSPRTPQRIQTPPPISPPRRIVPEGPDVFDRAMMHPGDFEGLDAGPPELYESPPGLKTPSPRRSPPRSPPRPAPAAIIPPFAYQRPVRSPTKTPPRGPDIFEMAEMYPGPFEGLDVSPVDLYDTPPGLRTPSPRQQAPATPEMTKEQLDAEIAALEAELELLKTPEHRPRPRGDDDMTPELDRQLWIQSVKMHDPVKYKRNKKFYVCDDPAVGLMEVIGWNPPELQTIMSPRHPVDPEQARQEKIQEMTFAANRDVISEMQKQWKKMKEAEWDYSDKYYDNMEQHESPIREHREREMRKFKPKIAWPASPPEIVPSPGPPPHMLDEPVPEDLPIGLIRPSGWTFQTPPHMRYKIPPVRKPREPTGFTPPRVIPRGVAMFNESPPEDLYASSLEDSPEPSPYRTPERIPQAEGYTAPDILDIAGYYPGDFEGFDDSPVHLYESPEGFKTPSPRQQAAAGPQISKAQLDAEIAALEAELELLKTPEQRPRGADEMTPELERQLWLQAVKHHEPVRYQRNKKSYVVPAPAKGLIEVKRYNPPQLETILSPRHPKDPQEECLQRIEDYSYQANRDVISDMRDLHRKKKEVPRHYNFIYYHNRAITDSHYCLLRHIRLRNHKPKMTWPESPPEIPPSPSPPLHILDEPVPEDLPRGIIRPAGWNYQTPPDMKYKIPPVRKYKTPSAVSPVRVKAPPPPGSLFYESPPLFDESPELAYSPPSMTDSQDIFFGSPPPELLISTSPPAYPSSGASSPLYASPARTPQGYQLSDISPVFMDSPESVIDLEAYPPVPPPRPGTPTAYSPKPRRIPRRRPPLDPNILYAATPRSAERSYQTRPEPIRFEQRRPMQLRPVSPELPREKYLETPVDAAIRPWKKRRQQPIDRNLTRKRLVFDEDEKQFEHEMIRELDANLRAASPGAPPLPDVLDESLPFQDLDFAEVSLLGDLEYEPEGFVLYQDPEAPQYNIRPAFEGRPDVDLMDTSPIRHVDQIPPDQRDFNWMGCGTMCPWS